MSNPSDFPDPTRSKDSPRSPTEAAAGAQVDVTVEHGSRSVDLEQMAALVERVVRGENRTLQHVTVVCGDHDLVRRLNCEYLDHDYNTDVLSFSLTETPDVVEGEVYIDLDTAAERHQEFGDSFEKEAARYVVHGVLHLCGYDDATPADKQRMHELEDRYLAGDL